MSEVRSYLLLLMVHSLAVTIIGVALMKFTRRNSARCYSIGLVAIIMLLVSPLTIVLFPNHWRRTIDAAGRQVPIGNKNAFENFKASSTANNEMRVIDPPWRPIEPEGLALSLDNNTREKTEATFIAQTPPKTDETRHTKYSRWAIDLACIVWLTGALIAAARVVRNRWNLAVALEPLQNVGHKMVVEDSLEKVKAALNVSTLPEIYSSRSAPVPMVWRVGNPIIVLPESLLREVSQLDLTSILIHECAHVVRYDPLTHLLQQIVGAFWWFHPGVAWINSRLSQSREELCDNYVLQQSSSVEFARVLLEASERETCQQFTLSLLGLFGRLHPKWTLEERICGLLNPERNTVISNRLNWMLGVGLLMLACSYAVGGVNSTSQQLPETQKVTSSQEGSTAKPSSTESHSVAPNLPPTDELLKSILGRCIVKGQEKGVTATVQFYKEDNSTRTLTKLAETTADKNGNFEFRDVKIDSQISSLDPAKFVVIAIAPRHSSAYSPIAPSIREESIQLELSDNPGSLSGVILDHTGKPLANASVYLPVFQQPVDGFLSAKSDEKGLYEIADLNRWESAEENIRIRHPDFPTAIRFYTAVPQVLNEKLPEPATIDGQVIDLVTGKPIPGANVRAENRLGQFFSESSESKTDANGFYKLKVNSGDYCVFADSPERVPIAIFVNGIEPGACSSGNAIRMVRGGFVKGKILTANGDPLPADEAKNLFVAHYGTARPFTASTTVAKVNPDGTYRIRVAPGRNYIYSMDCRASAFVDVGDDQEVILDMVIGKTVEDPQFEIDGKQRMASGSTPIKSRATDGESTKTLPELLTELREQNQEDRIFSESWAATIKAIVDRGRAAVPQLIDELDKTDDERMLRCLPFVLRAIGDSRAVPSLIRSIPRSLQCPPRSDMGLSLDNRELLAFFQEHDIDSKYPEKERFSFGRPSIEVFATLQKLTGHKMNDDELRSLHWESFPQKLELKMRLVDANATAWSNWWELNWEQFVKDEKYSKVNLEKFQATLQPEIMLDQRFVTSNLITGHILQPIQKSNSEDKVVYDLDTGRIGCLPQKWQGKQINDQNLLEFKEWASFEGYDLMGDQIETTDKKSVFVIRGVGLKLYQLSNEWWKNQFKDVNVGELLKQGHLLEGDLIISTSPTEGRSVEKTAPFLYVTREGIPGLLYLGIPVQDNSQLPGKPFTMGEDLEFRSIGFRKGRRFGLMPLIPAGRDP